MQFGVQPNHRAVGTIFEILVDEFTVKLSGVVDRVETGPMHWRRRDGTLSAKSSIRFRIKPEKGGRARWSPWYPDRGQFEESAHA